MTQKDMVLDHLTNIGAITPMDAMEQYGIMRLAAVINCLRNDGYDIITNIIHSVNRFGKDVYFASYIMGE